MKCLVAQINVLREIAVWRPNAHLAFLAHKAYRALYMNTGQDVVLAELWGKWIYFKNSFGREDLYFQMRHTNICRHPIYPAFAKTELWFRAYSEVKLGTCGLCQTYHAQYDMNTKPLYGGKFEKNAEYSELFNKLVAPFLEIT